MSTQNTNFCYVYIFDYTAGAIYEVELNDKTEELESEELLDYYGLNIDNCYTMYSQCKLEIEQIEPKDD